MTREGSHQAAGRRPADGELAELVARAANGDQAAWNALVDRLGPIVWATTRAHRLRPCDAADVVQTTWLRLVENLDSIADPGRVAGWLATTAQRECINVHRRARRTIPYGDDLPDLPCDAPHPGERVFADGCALATRAALQRLCPRDRTLVRMIASEPRPSYEEIGDALGMAVGSIGPARGRALARLRRELARSGLTADVIGVALA